MHNQEFKQDKIFWKKSFAGLENLIAVAIVIFFSKKS